MEAVTTRDTGRAMRSTTTERHAKAIEVSKRNRCDIDREVADEPLTFASR